MRNNRVSGTVRLCIGILRATERPHLQTVAGIGQGFLESQFRMRQTLNGGSQTCGIHEREHAVKAAVFRANQITRGAIKIHHTGGITVNTQLVFNRATSETVTVLRCHLGNRNLAHEQRNPFVPSGASANGLYDMNNACHIGSPADKNFGTGNGVAAIVIGLGFGPQHAQIGTAVRLGQAHGAGPLATHQPG